MTEIVAARYGFGWGWSLGEDNWNTGVDQNFRMNDTYLGLTIIDDTLTAPPGSPADGDTYIPAATATGAWATHEGKIAAYQNGTWYFYPVAKGLRALFVSGGFKYYTGSAWASELTNLGAVADKRLLANISGGTADVSAVSLTALLDDIISANQGAIITRGTTDWEPILPGTSGYALVSQGTSAIPQWSSLAAGGGGAVDSVLGHVGTVTLSDLVGSGLAPEASPTLTGTIDMSGGTVIVPTLTITSNTTFAASTSFVHSYAAPLASPVFTGTITIPNLILNGSSVISGLGHGLGINSGSIIAEGTLAYTGTAAGTVTIAPTSGVSDVIVNMPSSGGTITLAVSPAYAYQEWRTHIIQGATAGVLNLNSGFVFPTSGGPTSFTLTGTANNRDVLWMQAMDGTHAVVGALLQGITI